MLSAIYISRPFVFPLGAATALPEVADVEILLALEAVEKDAAEALSEVLLQPGDDLLQNVRFGRSLAALELLFLVVLVEDLIVRDLGRQRDEEEVLGDVFPVVDQDRLQVVGAWDADLGPR